MRISPKKLLTVYKKNSIAKKQKKSNFFVLQLTYLFSRMDLRLMHGHHINIKGFLYTNIQLKVDLNKIQHS